PPPESPERTGLFPRHGPKLEGIGARLDPCDIENLRVLVAVEVRNIHGDRLTYGGQWRRKAETSAGDFALADLLLLLREDVDLVPTVAVEVGEARGPRADQAGERLPGTQAGATGLRVDPDLRVGRVGDNHIFPAVAIQVTQRQRPSTFIALR